MFDNQISSTLVGNGFPERGFDLLCDAEVIENRELAGVALHDARTLGGNECYIIFYFVENGFVVHIDVFVRRVEQVAQHGYGTACFLINQ